MNLQQGGSETPDETSSHITIEEEIREVVVRMTAAWQTQLTQHVPAAAQPFSFLTN